MRIVNSLQSKVCVDGSLMKEYLLDEPLAETFLVFLERFGKVRRLEYLKKPYFSFEKEHFLSIKGFIGDLTVEIRYQKAVADLVADYFPLLLYYEREGESGITKLQGIGASIQKKIQTRLDTNSKDVP